MQAKLRALGFTARPLPLQTERDEIVALNAVPASVRKALPEAAMIELSPSAGPIDAPPALPAAWPSGAAEALSHPGLPGVARQICGHGYQLVLDTSLRGGGGSDPHSKELHHHLRSIGAYFSRDRRCIGLAADSAWHECVHELVHLRFDVARRAGRDPPEFDGFRAHWGAMRERGYSEMGAEEMVARAHEMDALRSGSRLAPWRWLPRALLLLDSTLQEASRDLQDGVLRSPPAEQAAAASSSSASAGPAAPERARVRQLAAAELRRVEWLRRWVSGPYARAAHLGALVLVPTLAISALVRRALGSRGDERAAQATARTGPSETEYE